MQASLPIGLAPAPPPAVPLDLPANPKASPRDAGKAFESMFASILFKQMRQTLTPGQGMFGHDPGDVLGGLFDHFMGQHITQKGGLGIGAVIEKHLEQRSANMNRADHATSAPEGEDLAALCANHLRSEETLLAAALPMVGAVQAAFTLRGLDAFAAALSGHQEFAKLIEEMNLRRQSFREALARRLGVAPRHITFARALAGLPNAVHAAIAADAARVQRLAGELAAANYSVSVYLRIHLDAYRRVLRDLTNSAAASGRYGPEGKAESHEYRPLFQIHG